MRWCIWSGSTSIHHTVARVEELWLPVTLNTVDVGGSMRGAQPERPCLSDLPFKVRKLLWSEATEVIFTL